MISYVIFILIFALSIYFTYKNYKTADVEKPVEPIDIPRKIVIKIFIIVFATRLVMMFLCWIVYNHFEGEQRLLNTFVHYDANHYIYIAENGYYSCDEGWIRIVFFPLYPFTTWLLNVFIKNTIVSSLLVSWTSLSIACIFMYKLVLIDYDKKTAFRAIKFLLIFPASVFLGAPYSESLFIALSLGCLYYARIRKYNVACIIAFFAALTRNVGVLLVIPIAIEILVANSIVPNQFNNTSISKFGSIIKNNIIIFIIPLGTLIYVFINQMTVGNPFAFLKIQEEHWFQTMGNYANTINTTHLYMINDVNLRGKIMLWLTQLIVVLAGGITLPLICKKSRVSYAAYSIVYVYIIFSPTWLLSGMRYYMGLVVFYPFIAHITSTKWLNILFTIMFTALTLIYAYGYSAGWEVY